MATLVPVNRNRGILTSSNPTLYVLKIQKKRWLFDCLKYFN
jgi:hypothetical protein